MLPGTTECAGRVTKGRQIMITSLMALYLNASVFGGINNNVRIPIPYPVPGMPNRQYAPPAGTRAGRGKKQKGKGVKC